jgi:large repetitive protein
VSASVTITEPLAINITLTPTNLTAFGSNDGIIIASVTGGVPNYAYNWAGPNGYINSGSSPTITGLAPGIYTLTIIDDIGCEESAITVINQPNCDVIITANYTSPLCFQDLGSITWVNSNGVGPYSNTLINSNSDTLYVGNNLTVSVTVPASVYDLIVMDAAGCQQIWNIALL